MIFQLEVGILGPFSQCGGMLFSFSNPESLGAKDINRLGFGFNNLLIFSTMKLWFLPFF